jgi:hypothetical protein
MAFLGDRAADVPEAIKAPATNLTIYSGIAAGAATFVAAFNKTFDSIFGDDAGANIKAAVLIAIIVAWALVAVADIFARAISKAATEAATAPATASAAGTVDSTGLIALPKIPAKKTEGEDETGYVAIALDPKAAGGKGSLLLVKEGKAPEWVKLADVRLSA